MTSSLVSSGNCMNPAYQNTPWGMLTNLLCVRICVHISEHFQSSHSWIGYPTTNAPIYGATLPRARLPPEVASTLPRFRWSSTPYSAPLANLPLAPSPSCRCCPPRARWWTSRLPRGFPFSLCACRVHGSRRADHRILPGETRSRSFGAPPGAFHRHSP